METKIDKKLLKELLRDQAKLNALEAGGVDNWEFYYEALSGYRATVELEEKVEETVQELAAIILEGVYEPSERGGGYDTRDENLEKAKVFLLKFINTEITTKETDHENTSN